MKVFHYTRLRNWRDISEAPPVDPERKLGLFPGIGLGQEYPPARSRHAIFALLALSPENWSQAPHPVFPEGKNPFRNLLDNIGDLLLEVDVDPRKAHVVDWAHREGYLRSGMPGAFTVPQHFAHRTRVAAERAYLESEVPLGEYVRRKMEYVLPEVLIEEHVPISNIRVADEQPALERKLAEYPGRAAIFLGGDAMFLDHVPGLSELRDRYHDAFDRAKKT